MVALEILPRLVCFLASMRITLPFVAIVFGRRLSSEDGTCTSIIVSGTSTCNYPLTI